MKKTILALALVAGFTSLAKAQQAFDFSFTGNLLEGSPFYADTIEGQLILNSLGTAATSVTVTNDVQGNISIVSTNFAAQNVNDNSFTVASIDGVSTITSANFDSTPGGDELSLNLYAGSYISQYVLPGALSINESGSDLGGVTFVAAVPEPATYILAGLGALVLIVAYRRRRA